MTNAELLYPKTVKNLVNAIKQFKNSKTISKQNKRDFLEFLTKLEADGTSTHQRISYFARVKPIAKLLGTISFKNATKKDMEMIFAQYRKSKFRKQSSLNKTIECVKCFSGGFMAYPQKTQLRTQ